VKKYHFYFIDMSLSVVILNVIYILIQVLYIVRDTVTGILIYTIGKKYI